MTRGGEGGLKRKNTKEREGTSGSGSAKKKKPPSQRGTYLEEKRLVGKKGGLYIEYFRSLRNPWLGAPSDKLASLRGTQVCL